MTLLFNDKELNAARVSKSGVMARSWNITEIRKYIQFKQIHSIDVLDDCSLYVTFALVPPGGKYVNVGVFDDFIIESDANSYQAFLEISGVSKPGESKYFL